MVTGVVPSAPRLLPSILIAHSVQQSHCWSIFHRVLLTHALAFSASPFVHKKKSLRIYTSMQSGGFELMNRTYTGLEDNLIRHRGDRVILISLERNGAVRIRSFHSNLSCVRCELVNSGQPARTDNSSSDFCGGTLQLDYRARVR